MITDRRPIVFVKLGGSLITDKKRPEASRRKVLQRLAEEVARARPEIGESVLLGHGSGSFGHPEAERWRLAEGFQSSEQLAGIATTQDLAARLHRIVVEALAGTGLPPFSIAPSSALIARSGRPSRLFYEPMLTALGLGLLPVVYGDVVMDQRQGVTIVSTETLFLHISRRLAQLRWKVTRALWAGETPGVVAPGGGTVPRITAANLREALEGIEGAAGPDVTGGMRHRVETAHALARIGVPSLIFDATEPGALERALRGEEVPGTRVEG